MVFWWRQSGLLWCTSSSRIRHQTRGFRIHSSQSTWRTSTDVYMVPTLVHTIISVHARVPHISLSLCRWTDLDAHWDYDAALRSGVKGRAELFSRLEHAEQTSRHQRSVRLDGCCSWMGLSLGLGRRSIRHRILRRYPRPVWRNPLLQDTWSAIEDSVKANASLAEQ